MGGTHWVSGGRGRAAAGDGRRATVVFIGTGADVGGLERLVCNLGRGCAIEGVSAMCIFPASGVQPEFVDWCESEGVTPVLAEEVLNPGWEHSWTNMLRLARLVRSTGATVVNISYGSNFAPLKDVLALRLSGRRTVVVTIHHPTPWSSNMRRKRLMTRLSTMLADHVTTPSQATRDVLLEAGVRPEKVTVLRVGLRIAPSAGGRSACRATLRIPEQAYVIGCMSRLVPHKAIDELIHAIAGLNNPSAFFVLAGDGPSRDELTRLCAEVLPGRHLVLGHVERSEVVLEALDVFALPSASEGFGLVFVEAAFVGVPAVGIRAGGVPEAIQDGRTGLLVEPGDRPGLVAALTALESVELRTSLGEHARARAIEEFSEESMSRKFLQLVGLNGGLSVHPRPWRRWLTSARSRPRTGGRSRRSPGW